MGREEEYTLLLAQMQELLVANSVSNMANAAALLWSYFHSQPSPKSMVNWAGFYTVEKSGALELGPFQGNVACQRIEIGKGVCGTAAASKQTQIVEDVHQFPGHIACDAASSSEIVVPMIRNGNVLGVIDIDCTETKGFDVTDKVYLEKLASLLASKFS